MLAYCFKTVEERERDFERMTGLALGKEKRKKGKEKKPPAQLEESRGESTQAKRWQLELEPTERLQIRDRTGHGSATDYCL